MLCLLSLTVKKDRLRLLATSFRNQEIEPQKPSTALEFRSAISQQREISSKMLEFGQGVS
jgi:hypothetical protein